MLSCLFSWMFNRPTPGCSSNHEIVLTSQIAPSLPDEVLVEIFSRLPAKHVLRCRSVCRRWKALTSTHYFAELHRRNHCIRSASLSVLVEKNAKLGEKRSPWEENYDVKKKLYSLDDGWRVPKIHTQTGAHELILESQYRHLDEDEEYESSRRTKSTFYMSFSSCGLLVFHHQKMHIGAFTSHCIILNPITREKLRITLPNNVNNSNISSIDIPRGQVYALFFHPVMKEFCLLWGQLPPLRCRRSLDDLEYKLLNLGPSQSCWKTISKPTCLNINRPRLFSCSKRVVPPVVLEDVVYWMVGVDGDVRQSDPCLGAILAFDIQKEEFHLLPHPGPGCSSERSARENHNWMQLLEMNDNADDGPRLLSLCEILHSTQERLINIWILNDRTGTEEVLWIKKHMVKLHFPSLSRTIYPDDLRTIGLLEGELLLMHWEEKGLIVHNLKLGTTQLFLTKKGKNESDGAFMLAHSHSFISMKNSKSEFLVETDAN